MKFPFFNLKKKNKQMPDKKPEHNASAEQNKESEHNNKNKENHEHSHDKTGKEVLKKEHKEEQSKMHKDQHNRLTSHMTHNITPSDEKKESLSKKILQEAEKKDVKKEKTSPDLANIKLEPLSELGTEKTNNKTSDSKPKHWFQFSKPVKENKSEPKKVHVDEKVTQAEADAHRKYYKKQKKEKRRVTKILDDVLEKSGYEIRGEEYKKRIKRISVLIGIIASLILIIGLGLTSSPVYVVIISLLLSFTACTALIYILLLISSFIFMDYVIYQRTKEIEEVLPEFLQLASANISAGMPIDRALWFAVRPKFGVLAKEIEEVAKATMAGEDLEEALEKFTKKYDSKVLKESMTLLIEGMRAGGEIGFLLNQIASNMQDIKIMRKEIAASVMSYVIFITIAAIVGAPFLLALSAQLLVIMGSLSSSMQFENDGASTSTFNIDMSGDSISIHDFRIFAVVVLLFSSVFSAMIISVIRKGNTNESLKIIPGYIFISLLIFFAASALFGGLLGSFF